MTVVKVKIQSEEDAKKGIPVVEGMNNDNMVEANELTVAILENGTVGGQMALAIILKTPVGNHIVGQMTERQFEAICGAYLGAKERFGK